MKTYEIVELIKNSNIEDKGVLKGLTSKELSYNERQLPLSQILNIYKIRLRNKPSHHREVLGLEQFVSSLTNRCDKKIVMISVKWDNNNRVIFLTEDRNELLGIF